MEPYFRTLAPWLRARFGRPIARIALDAGSTCPNRDGTKGFGGCVYCDVEGSGSGALRSGRDLAEQLDLGLAKIARRGDGAGAIAYFQSYSNTYVDLARLREVLGVVEARIARSGGATSAGATSGGATSAGATSAGATSAGATSAGATSSGPGAFVPIVAVSIATRPDTLPDDALRVLVELSRRVEVWVELGLEAADDDVLREIRRFHTVAEFDDAVRRVREAGLVAVGHAILGLPGDGREGARRTAAVLARSGVLGVKVHDLMVLRRTQLEKDWRAGRVAVLEPEEYVEWLADFVERLSPEQVLHRLTADAAAGERVAPRANLDKNEVRERLAATLAARGTRQGSFAAEVSSIAPPSSRE